MSPRAGCWLALLIPLSVAASAAEEESLLSCRKIDDADERLACYDRVVDRTREELKPEASATAPRASSSASPSAPPPANSAEDPDATLRDRLFGRTAGETAHELRRTFGIEAPESISTTAAGVSRTANRLIEVTLANGQVWRQEDAVTFSVRVGDSIEIKSGALGSYYLTRNGRGRTIRVTRVR